MMYQKVVVSAVVVDAADNDDAKGDGGNIENGLARLE
jgi:hypothetical protein